MSLVRPWAYRPWKGVGLWAVATAVDFVTVPFGTRAAGLVSLSGFAAALLWAQYGPQPEVTDA